MRITVHTTITAVGYDWRGDKVAEKRGSGFANIYGVAAALGRLTDSGICSFSVDDGARCDLYKVCGTCRVTRIDTSKHI